MSSVIQETMWVEQIYKKLHINMGIAKQKHNIKIYNPLKILTISMCAGTVSPLGMRVNFSSIQFNSSTSNSLYLSRHFAYNFKLIGNLFHFETIFLFYVGASII